MPQIIVTADPTEDDAPVTLRERVTLSDFESGHFAKQLIERLAWAVEDAHEYTGQPRDERTTRDERVLVAS
jgi:hypothetical protein